MKLKGVDRKGLVEKRPQQGRARVRIPYENLYQIHGAGEVVVADHVCLLNCCFLSLLGLTVPSCFFN